MEFTLMQTVVATPELARSRVSVICSCVGRRMVGRNQIDFGPARTALKRRSASSGLRSVRAEMAAVTLPSSRSEGDMAHPVRLFVGLPLDVVSKCSINQEKAIAYGLRALKLLGIQGVELPLWWSIVQPESSATNWSVYLALADLVRRAGLQLRVSLHLHSSAKPAVPLPSWISRIADANPDVLFTDLAGRRSHDCLSFAVDDLPVLNGRTPMEVYEDFFLSFRSAFSEFVGNTITEISVSLGPNGELRYPSFPPNSENHQSGGIGVFQCYDKYMLANLKKHAEENGNPLWGLGGPHDAPAYNQNPDTSGFFRENHGSWETPYGNFFLTWYSEQLLQHGNRLLSLGHKVFGDMPVTLSAKVPLLHNWYMSRSHPAELTSGFYNVEGRDGYDAVAAMFVRNHFAMIVPGFDFADGFKTQGSLSDAELLLSQILEACHKNGVRVFGENMSLTKLGIERIKRHLFSDASPLRSFTYQRMGANFFSPEHFPLFTDFVRSLELPELDADDVLSNMGGKISLPIDAASGNGSNRLMQTV
ncbi:hypothetical protein HPP92_013694 [Vanilla planifolia]|uniref:Beta-amylase n=1 Tax=Vanilla planifolia TaxID=51239 RepID=A0A835QYQ9_VANPL|nr:hypothetical protein HPP92_013694 [Vanilla planifolia]